MDTWIVSFSEEYVVLIRTLFLSVAGVYTILVSKNKGATSF